MDRATRMKQQKLIKRTQRRLNRLVNLLMKVHLSKRSNPSSENDVFEEFVRRSLVSNLVGTGFSPGPFGLTTMPAEPASTTEVADLNDVDLPNLCIDIRGRDRACCNTAMRCFNGVNGVVDELDSAPPNSFTLMSACRRVGSELKKDKLCVQKSLSQCAGPDRGLLQRRFDGRVNTLYDQFYAHCRDNLNRSTTKAPTTTTTTVAPSKVQPTTRVETETPSPTNTASGFFPTSKPGNHDGHAHDHTFLPPGDVGSGSGALLAGVLTGGIILGLILIVAVILWCKNRRDSNGSNGSMDSSAGIFFQKKPNMFSSDRPRGGNNNNNKPPVMRQDSDIYAEIDEAMVNPGFKPPLPGSLQLPGYLNPVSDDDSSSYTPPPSHNPRAGAVTTRGQLSYGPILAANGAGTSDQVTPYHSTTLTFPDGKKPEMKASNSRETLLSPKNLLNDENNDRFRMSDLTDMSDDGLDEYEQPISTGSSLRYATLEPNDAPQTMAPAVPEAVADKLTPDTSGRKKSGGVKVLPSNPFAPFGAGKKGSPSSKAESKSPVTDNTSNQPVPTPRKKKEQTKDDIKTPKGQSSVDNELVKRSDAFASNRDSHVSNASSKSSHHYFVLEPELGDKANAQDYENSVSSPKLV